MGWTSKMLALFCCVGFALAAPQFNCSSITGNEPVFPPAGVAIGEFFNATASSTPFVFKLSPALDIASASISVQVYPIVAYNSGCTTDSSAMIVTTRNCNPNTVIVSNTIAWINGANYTYNESLTLTGSVLPVDGTNYFSITQGTKFLNTSIITCNPYSVTVRIEGNFTKTCANGVLDLVSGNCNCTANYTGDLCTFKGPCDPTKGSSPCTSGKGLRYCLLANSQLETQWSTCLDVSCDVPNTRIYMYIGIGVSVAIACIGIFVGYRISKRRAAYAPV